MNMLACVLQWRLLYLSQFHMRLLDNSLSLPTWSYNQSKQLLPMKTTRSSTPPEAYYCWFYCKIAVNTLSALSIYKYYRHRYKNTIGTAF